MKVYLSGPIFKCAPGEAEGWRKRIKEALPEHEFLDPVDMGYTEADYTLHFNRIVNDDLTCIDNADMVIAHVPYPSIGTAMEIWYAFSEAEVPVLIITELTHAWLLHTACLIVDNVEGAIMAMRHLPIDRQPNLCV